MVEEKGTMYNPETREEVMQGGVKIAFSREDVETYASNILGNLLVTIQTGEEGKIVNNLYIESGCAIAHEYYLALLVDRESKDVLIMASTEGGMDIEDVAHNTPELIHKINVDPNSGLLGFQKKRPRNGTGAIWKCIEIILQNAKGKCMTCSSLKIVQWLKSIHL